MINLFDYFDAKTELLYKSLQLAGHNNPTIVLHDDGFLPDEVMSPYRFFAHNLVSPQDKPRFFNEIEVPRFWEIEGNNDEAWIKELGEKRGKICYRPNDKPRIVQRVEWYDKDKVVRFVDHYTKTGIKYAQTVYDKKGKAILKKYMDRNGKEIIYENYVTRDVVLDWEGQTYFFDSEVAFILFYIEQLNIEMDGFIINSLATSFGVLYNLETKGEDVLFWQEQSNGVIPGNMKMIFNNEMRRKFKVNVPSRLEYQTLMNYTQDSEKKFIRPSGYLFKYDKKNQHSENALIMTNSDQIEHIETIVMTSPNITFHIAAVTEMSSKLMNLEQHPNVKLYPTITNDKIQKLYKTCDVFLDINEGKEIVGAVQKAFDNDMLILGYKEIAHNRNVTSPTNLFSKVNELPNLNETLTYIFESKEAFDQRLESQKLNVNEVSKAQFNAALNAVIE
ncbi:MULTISPECIES: accessory Sec system glycosylation chaperone GtfB [Staphylococcus]|uniref:UDP-N-acetylglucosamine--peptide N-acetylglucosaminyltransferase stabilizing protein GtfB n=1 Tax=Staphylococcus hsinchuensis TaxID=3051183 RepID=A0ABZ3EEU9_9STAP|nr:MULTISPECIES: accessory Sec system glycosylation chaperone GtfB [unclassified Staphylococcus]